MTKVGHQEAYGRHQSSGLRRSWLDPNFSASSDLSCISVMEISSPLTSSESVRSPFDSPFGSLGSPATSPPRDASALAERENFEETPTKLDLQINQVEKIIQLKLSWEPRSSNQCDMNERPSTECKIVPKCN